MGEKQNLNELEGSSSGKQTLEACIVHHDYDLKANIRIEETDTQRFLVI